MKIQILRDDGSVVWQGERDWILPPQTSKEPPTLATADIPTLLTAYAILSTCAHWMRSSIVGKCAPFPDDRDAQKRTTL
jgi:hypothetical protein